MIEVGSAVRVVKARKRTRYDVCDGDVGIVISVDEGNGRHKHNLPWRVRFPRSTAELWVFRNEVEEVK